MHEEKIAGYEIIETIGEGGMGTVFKARQLSLDRTVALKVLAPHLVNGEDDIERFRLEAQAAANLRHESIVQVYDAGEDNGQYYFAMAYIDGINIADWLERSEQIDQEQTLITAESVGTALDYAWTTAKIIHRDIKPENVLVDSDGTIKLVDLGVIKMAGTSRHVEDGNRVFGTPNYCSPEQATGETNLDCRSDIYSLGAMMYHMVTGSLPFGEAEGSDALVKHVTEQLEDPRAYNPKITGSMVALMAKMMAKDREQRYTNWPEALSDIKRVQKGKAPQQKLPPGEISTIKVDASSHGQNSSGKRIVVKKPGQRVSSAKVNATLRNARRMSRPVARSSSDGSPVAAILTFIVIAILIIIGLVMAYRKSAM